MVDERFMFFAASAAYAFFGGLVALGGDLGLTSDLVYARLGRPATCSVRVENGGADGIGIRKVSTGSESLLVLRYAESVPAGGVSEIELLLLPDRAGEVFIKVDVELEYPVGKRLTCAVQGMVGEAAESKAAEYSRLRAMLKTVGPRSVFTPDAKWYCAPSDVRGKPVVFVDIRPESDYRAAHLPGAINVPAYALTSRAFFKGKDVVLVDDGGCRRETEALCPQIERRGAVSARILDGGLLGWCEGGNALEGQNREGVQKLKAESLDLLIRCGKWQTVYVGTNTAAASVFLPGSLAIPLSSLKQSRESARQWPSGVPGGGRILLVGDADVAGADLAAVRNLSGRRVYSLAGGLDAAIRRLALLAKVGFGKKESVTHLPRMMDQSRTSAAGGVRRKGGCGCSGS